MSKRNKARAPAPNATPGRMPAKQPARSAALPWIIGGGLLALALAVGALLSRSGSLAPATATPLSTPVIASAISATPAGRQWPQGPAAQCASNPQFVKTFGFDAQLSALSTSERTIRGLALIEIGPKGDTSKRGKVFQHPSWRAAGFLGPIVRDGGGNIWVAPVPVITLEFNAPERQNDLYRADAVSGVLTRVLSLPPAQAPDATNPFGVIGMALDCDTNSLYVSSIMGSTRGKERGRLFRVDLQKNQVTATYEGIDAFGMAVYNGAAGKRLYLGAARAPEIRSIALRDDGAFGDDMRKEISLEDLGPRGDDRARRISFSASEEMQIHGVEFNFNLIAPTERQETQYRFKFDAGAGKWINAQP